MYPGVNVQVIIILIVVKINYVINFIHLITFILLFYY
jgi:hypothetical protein